MKLLIVIIFAFNAFGFVSYPKPSGPFQVGVRNDIAVSNFIVSIYYPAEVPNEGPVNEPKSGLVNSWQGLFDIANDPDKLSCGQDNVWWLFSPVAKLFKYTAQAGTYFTAVSARPGLPVLGNGQKKFPVVLFSHGYASFHAFHLALIQELASHGFIVIGIDHPCPSADSEQDPKSLNEYIKKNHQWEVFWDMRRFQPRINDYDEVISLLLKNSSGNELFKSMNLENMAIVGQSRGAGGAMMAAKHSKFRNRLKAIVSLDGERSNEKIETKIPFLILLAGSHSRGKWWLENTFTNPESKYLTRESFDVDHHEFSDVAVFKETGEPNFHERYSKMVVGFLTHHLKP